MRLPPKIFGSVLASWGVRVFFWCVFFYLVRPPEIFEMCFSSVLPRGGFFFVDGASPSREFSIVCFGWFGAFFAVVPE